MRKPKLPTGIDNFKKIRNGNYYYVDKTSLVEQILNNGSEVTLFTRPRRFGKSLNMSMIQHFFEIGTDPALFDGLKISKNTEICEQYMGKYPVISISLKGIDADSYEKARAQLIKTINREARRFQFLLESDKLSRVDKALFSELLTRNMEEDTITSRGRGSSAPFSAMLRKMSPMMRIWLLAPRTRCSLTSSKRSCASGESSSRHLQGTTNMIILLSARSHGC